MFDKQKYEDRLSSWSRFRDVLSTSEDTIQEVINFYDKAPRVSINTDPWDKKTWPTPWELVAENQYCNFCILLGICYTLQLSNCFTGEKFEIYIGTNIEKSKTMYVLKIKQFYIIIDQNGNTIQNTNTLDITIEKQYVMPELN